MTTDALLTGDRSTGAPVILTPEHVPIQLVPAGLAARFLAVMIDFFVVLGLGTVCGFVIRFATPLGIGPALATTVGFVLTWGYHVYFEVRRNGQTPGKRAMRLRVVDSRGLPITPQQSFVRNIIRALDFAPLFYGIGAVVSLFDGHNRRLGDIAAGTIVIRETRPLDYSKQLAHERRFNSLRTPGTMRFIRRIGLEEREFLLSLCIRAPVMEQKARFDLMELVGEHYRRKLQVEELEIGGENLIRDLTAILCGD